MVDNGEEEHWVHDLSKQIGACDVKQFEFEREVCTASFGKKNLDKQRVQEFGEGCVGKGGRFDKGSLAVRVRKVRKERKGQPFVDVVTSSMEQMQAGFESLCDKGLGMEAELEDVSEDLREQGMSLCSSYEEMLESYVAWCAASPLWTSRLASS